MGCLWSSNSSVNLICILLRLHDRYAFSQTDSTQALFQICKGCYYQLFCICGSCLLLFCHVSFGTLRFFRGVLILTLLLVFNMFSFIPVRFTINICSYCLNFAISVVYCVVCYVLYNMKTKTKATQLLLKIN